MKVKDILKGASVVLSKFDLVNKFDDENGASDHDIQVLLEALNLVLSEIACDYIPLYKVEDIEAVNNAFDVNTLSYPLLAIRSIKDRYGRGARFIIDGDNIKLLSGKYQIKYTYKPDKVKLDDEIKGFDRGLTDRVIIYGVVSEYYLINGLYSEAELMRGKFEGALTSACKKLNNIIMRGRIWG